MAIVDLHDSDEKIKALIAGKSVIKCNLVSLNGPGKNRVKFFLREALSIFKAEEYLEDLFLSVMELCFNAVKANYGHLTAMERMCGLIDTKGKTLDVNTVMENPSVKKMYKNFVNHPSVKERVKEIIHREAGVFKIQERATKEGRELTEEEQVSVDEAYHMMKRSQDYQVKATLSISKSDNRVIVDVINDAPIVEEGLERIASKRQLFREYYEKDMIAQFYIENLDTTESAGFGAAMIDSRFLSWGMDPEKHFKVLSLNNKTCATLTIVL